MLYLRITARDPLIARDGRPFGLGIRMKSLDWPYPSVLAGAFRTMLGKEMNCSFDENGIKALKRISISGPLPIYKGKLYVPAPNDILIREENATREHFAVRPANIDVDEWKKCNCDLPLEGILPAMLPLSIEREFKPAKIPSLWSMDVMKKWLRTANNESFESPPDPMKIITKGEFLDLPRKDARTHVKIDPKLGTSEDSKLFETVGLDLSLKGELDGIDLAARIEDEGEFMDLASKIDSFHTIGGERRLAHWRVDDNQRGWNFPSDLAQDFAGKKRVRMILASPAIFSDGWKPGWLMGWPKGKSPDYWPNELNLKLVSACMGRWKPISGWSLEEKGAKPIRRLVPAGSVYFFELEGDEDASIVAKNLWLKSVCDDEQDRKDGFGLALWGIWDYADETNVKVQE